VDDARALDANRRALASLEEACERFFGAGRHEDAAAAAELAGRLAWMNHPGVFASARVEDVLTAIAAERFSWPAPALAPTDGPQRVLHVLTEGYDTGGHTRLAWRWMLEDDEREHSAVLTRQRVPMPEPLAAAVRDRGGELLTLPPTAQLLERAAALRALALTFDVLVLHPHPDDPLPLLALSAGARPPIVVENHADHTFSLGRALADAIVSPRPVGDLLASTRRGIPAERSAVLEVPLSGVEPGAVDRAAARRELGLPDDVPVLLTVASHYKYEPVAGIHLLDVVEPALRAVPDALLLAVGPHDVDRWAAAREATGGRVRALGRKSDLAPYYAAADGYLESYPFSSLTAVSEAAAHGTPVLAFAPDAGEAEIYGSRATDGWQRAHTPADYAERLIELLTDAAARERWGRAAKDVVAGARDGAAWRERVEELYARAARLGPLRREELTPPVEAADAGASHDLAVLRLHAHSGSAIPADVVRRITAQVAAAARSDEVRGLFGSLAGPAGVPEQRARYDRAFAAPGPDAGAIAATVEQLRALDAAGAAAQCLLGVAPEHVDVAIPLIEAALAAGEDFDLELVACADPAAYAAAPGTLLVAA
jgi:hypothetical protein